MTTDTARPTDRYVPNDSLLKVLLRVRPLQRDLLGFLLEQVLNASTDPSIRASIVLHLKACDVVYDPSAFTASVLEILPALDRQIQMDFIALFPSFALARDYERIVGDLMDLTHADTELVSSVLEAVSNLSLAPTSRALAASVERALELLSSCSPCQLPPVVRFLLDTAHAEVAERVLEQLRCAVSEFVALALSERGEDRKACLSAEALLLGILKISFYSKSLLFTVFYKHFSGDSAPDVTTFDLWVMYCLGSCKKLKARLHTLICRLMSTGKIGHEHVSASLARSGYPLEDTLPSMLELAQNTLGSTRLGAPGASLQLFGRLLYRELYKEFKSGSSRQEVVAALVAHAGSPCTTEVNAALSVLRDLCEWEADQPPSKAEATLRSFLPFLKSLLDDITRFTPEQNRTVFTVIFRCRRTGKEPTQDYDDIMIMLRKLCVSTDLQRRKVSVIGVIIYLSLSLEEDWTGSSEHHRTFHHVVRQTREDPGTRVALLDEIFQSLQACAASNTTVCQSLGDAIADLCIHTLHSFVLEQSPSTESLSNRDPRLLQCDKRLSLREDCCRTVYLYSGCIESTKVTRAVPPIDTLAPAVRVLSALALLRPDLAHTVLDLTVLPLELPSEDSLDRSEDFTQSTRDNLCYSLRYAVDWTRECVNAMCRHVSNDSSSASKLDLLARINHMIDLESVLLNQSQRNGKFCDAMFPFAMGSTKAVRARKGKAEKDNTLQSAKHAAPKDEVDAKGLEVLFAAVLRKSDYANTLALRYVTRADEGSLCKTPFHLLTRRAILRLVGQIADASARNFEGDAHAVKSLFADSSFSALRDILEWVSGTLGEERIMTDCDPEDCYAFIVASAALVSSVLGCKGTRNEALQYCTQVKAGAWSELPLVFTVLLSLSGGASDSLDDKSAVSLLEDVSFSVFEYFAALVPKLTDVEALECVVSCVKLLDDLLGIIAQLPRDAHNDIIADLFPQKGSELSLLCDDILRRNWKDSINKRKYSVKDIFVLVKISVKWALKPYQRIQILVDDVLMELKDTDNWLGPAENYPTLTAASFVLYFSAIFQSIGEQWMLTIEAYNGGELEPEESLRRLKSLANSFTGLVHLTRMHEELEKKSVLITALREGRKFVEAFLNQTNLKIVSGLFDDYQDSILAIIKNVQKATRQLQSILSHGKLSRSDCLNSHYHTYVYNIVIHV